MASKTDTISVNKFGDFLEEFSSLQESIDNIIKQEGYVRHRVEKKILQQSGNFLSTLYEVNIFSETIDGEKITPLFIKKVIKIEKITLADICDLYSREQFVYNKLFRIFITLQDDANLPNDERFTFVKTYNSDNDAIIMENLSKKGFKTYNKNQDIPLKFVELSIKQLAKFHAFSYVIKKKDPQYFDDKIKVLGHPFNLNSDWEGFIRNICSVTVQLVKGEAKSKIKNYAPRMIRTFHKYIKDIIPSNGCLCHGDYKFLNIMFKEVDGEPSAVQPIDYQLVYYGSPVDDFLFLIFTSTDRAFRRKHLSYLKGLYFESFDKFLSYFNVDVNSAYSRQEFEKDYEERLELGLVYGLLLSAFTFAHVDEGFDVRKLYLSELPIVPDEMFADRVKDIIEEYIDWGYL